MKIVFSRHAKRRAKLYNIAESTISTIVAGQQLRQGENVIVKFAGDLHYPLKIVILVEKDKATIITNYPLKKGRKK